MAAPQASNQPDGEVLAGIVEQVTFHNADTGFCVLRVKARGHRDLATVVGHAAMISAGEWITASGDWVNERTHGQQFRARFLRASASSSIEGILRYLASGMIGGIGPVYARNPREPRQCLGCATQFTLEQLFAPRVEQAGADLVLGATSAAVAPGAKLSIAISSFWSAVQDRRGSPRVITSIGSLRALVRFVV